MREVAVAYALAAVFFFLAPASNASLPPYEKLMKELYDDEQARLYDNPLDFKAAAKVVIDEPKGWDGVLRWSIFGDNLGQRIGSMSPAIFRRPTTGG